METAHDAASRKVRTMNKEQLPFYAIALATLIVGLLFAGVPVGTLLVVPLVLACPLMMFFMMRRMSRDEAPGDHQDQEPRRGPR